jgi:hypothetical protein
VSSRGIDRKLFLPLREEDSPRHQLSRSAEIRRVLVKSPEISGLRGSLDADGRGTHFALSRSRSSGKGDLDETISSGTCCPGGTFCRGWGIGHHHHAQHGEQRRDPGQRSGRDARFLGVRYDDDADRDQHGQPLQRQRDLLQRLGQRDESVAGLRHAQRQRRRAGGLGADRTRLLGGRRSPTASARRIRTSWIRARAWSSCSQ